MEHYLDKGEVTQSAKDVFWGWSLEKWLDSELTARGTGGGGEAAAPTQSFASNAEAVAALGVGKIYQSTTLINGSPIILITV